VGPDGSIDAIGQAEVTNTFTFGKFARNTKKGTATQVIAVPGPGVATLKGSTVASVSVEVSDAGDVTLRLKAKGAAKKKLKKKGKAKLKTTVTYTPTAGAPSVQSKQFTLKLKKKK
jgi:hypothetical protein